MMAVAAQVLLVCTTVTVTAAETATLSAGKLRSLAEDANLQGNYAQAIDYLQQAKGLEPESALNYYKLYKLKLRKRDYSGALADITQAAQRDDTSEQTYQHAKAKLLVTVGQCAQAVGEYEKLTPASLQNEYIKDYQTAQHCQQVIGQAETAFLARDYRNARSYYSQAMSLVESEDVASGHIITVIQSGFELHERLLRPAMVVVSK